MWPEDLSVQTDCKDFMEQSHVDIIKVFLFKMRFAITVLERDDKRFGIFAFEI